MPHHISHYSTSKWFKNTGPYPTLLFKDRYFVIIIKIIVLSHFRSELIPDVLGDSEVGEKGFTPKMR